MVATPAPTRIAPTTPHVWRTAATMNMAPPALAPTASMSMMPPQPLFPSVATPARGFDLNWMMPSPSLQGRSVANDYMGGSGMFGMTSHNFPFGHALQPPYDLTSLLGGLYTTPSGKPAAGKPKRQQKLTVTRKARPKWKFATKVEAKAAAKAKKQITLNEWTLNIDKFIVKRLDHKLREGAERHKKSLLLCAEELLDKAAEKGKPAAKDTVSSSTMVVASSRLPKQNPELTWNQRATVIFWLYHDKLGKRNVIFTAKVFGVSKPNTIQGWLRPSLAHLWYPIVKSLTIESVIQAVPTATVRELYFSVMYKVQKPHIPVKFCIVRPVSSKGILVHVAPSSKNGRKAVVAAKKAGAIILKRESHRAVGRNESSKRKHLDVHLFIEKTVTERWNQGDAIHRVELTRKVVSKFVTCSHNAAFVVIYLGEGKEASLSKFVSRSISSFGFVTRSTSVSQKIPINWRDLAVAGALRVGGLFRKERVEVCMSMDEIFTKFHESYKSVLTPIGAKRIGSAIKVDNDKAGCTTVVGMEMISGQLLLPMIIHKGAFGGPLMKKWQKHTKSTVLSTQSHWMTEETCILYLQLLVQLYPDKIIGVIWDNATCHKSKMVLKWVTKFNLDMETEGKRTRLVLEFVDNCLAAIYQPCDVVVNAILKRILRRKYHQKLSEMVESRKIAPGDTLKISREDLTQWIEETCKEVNDRQVDENFYVSKALGKCGLDFRVDNWDKDEPAAYKRHLDGLSEDGLYSSLTAANEAAKLKATAHPARF